MDYGLFSLINHAVGSSPAIDAIMTFIAGKAALLFALSLLALWFLGDRNSERVTLYALISLVFAVVLAQIAGFFFSHERPFAAHAVNQLLDHAANNAFPSTHAVSAFAIAVSVFRRNRQWGIPLMALACLTAFSRVYVGVHYPSDILAGVGCALVATFSVDKAERFLNPFVKLALHFYGKHALLLVQRIQDHRRKSLSQKAR